MRPIIGSGLGREHGLRFMRDGEPFPNRPWKKPRRSLSEMGDALVLALSVGILLAAGVAAFT